MRILYYNWTPLNVKSTGGGVAVYVHNLIQYICKKSTDDFDVTFLSSGYYFDDTKKEVYIRKEETHSIGAYSIINSPVIAPLGCMSYNGYEMLLKDNKLVEVFDGFIQKYGPFDVVHFQTLEGLSPQVLSLKFKYPNIKFIHSLHDYGCFCPNVKFWTKGGENCVLKQGTEDCYRCNIYAGCRPLKSLMVERNGKKQFRFMRRMGIGLSLINRVLFDLRTPLLDKNSIYQSYRKSCVNHINQYIDVEKSSFCYLSPVQYEDVKLSLKNLRLSDAMNFKSKVWEYEQEQRMIFYSGNAVESFYPIENVEMEAVYLGVKINRENESKIRKEMADTGIQVFKMKYDNKDLLSIKPQ